MYLSRIAINPYLPEARSVLSNTRSLHVAVMQMFTGYTKDVTGKSTDRRKGSGVPLWRIDAARDSLSLFVLSGDKPDTSVLARRIGWDDDTDGAVVVADYGPFIDSVREGQTYAFRVTANMITRTRGDEASSTVKAATSPNAKLAWLSKNAAASGFRIESLPRVEASVDTFTKVEDGDERIVTLDKSVVNGVLTVLDEDAFRRTLTAGFGRGRAYGCGLMTLAPVE